MPDPTTLETRLSMLRAESKAAVRRARLISQLAAQCAEEIEETLQPKEAQGNGGRSED